MRLLEMGLSMVGVGVSLSVEDHIGSIWLHIRA